MYVFCSHICMFSFEKVINISSFNNSTSMSDIMNEQDEIVNFTVHRIIQRNKVSLNESLPYSQYITNIIIDPSTLCENTSTCMSRREIRVSKIVITLPKRVFSSELICLFLVHIHMYEDVEEM